MIDPFGAFELEKVHRLTREQLDELPFGVIVVDQKGTILEYNAYESSLARLTRDSVVGRNFFHDVAPCTAIREFEGRFDSFLRSTDTSVEPFEFLFPFKHGAQRVFIHFLRASKDADRATICVLRHAESEKKPSPS